MVRISDKIDKEDRDRMARVLRAIRTRTRQMQFAPSLSSTKSLINFKTSMMIREVLLNGPSSRIGLSAEETAGIRRLAASQVKAGTNMK